MGITIKHEPVGAIQQLATMAGKSRAAQRQAEISQQTAMQAQRLQYQKAMADFQADLRIQAEQRAMQWELQKMELRSTKDFEREEMRLDALAARELAKEIKEKDEFELLQKQIRELVGVTITPEEGQEALAKLQLQRFGYSPSVIPRGAEQNQINAYIQDLLREGSQQAATPGPVTKQGITSQETALEQQGKIRVISPEGKAGTILLSEWPEYKAKDFQLESMSMQKGGLVYKGEMAGAQEGLRSLNPIAYLKAKAKMDELKRKYPQAFKQYLEEIKQGNK